MLRLAPLSASGQAGLSERRQMRAVQRCFGPPTRTGSGRNCFRLRHAFFATSGA
jgi:hypothetical protein